MLEPEGLQARFMFEEELPPESQGVSPRLTEWAPEHWRVADDWRPLVDQFLHSGAGLGLAEFMRERLAAGAVIYPPQPMRALDLTPLAQVRVVILGQDPYHGPGQAEGLAFSVAPGVKLPPSLRNIFKEIARSSGAAQDAQATPGSGSLVRWAHQGVLLLNTCLTVEDGRPASHAQRGWELLTDEVVKAVAASAKPVVFLLWGAHAQTKQGLIAANCQAFDQTARSGHLLLMANHPSPLSALRAPRPFLGCNHFNLANNFLNQHGAQSIDWST